MVLDMAPSPVCCSRHTTYHYGGFKERPRYQFETRRASRCYKPCKIAIEQTRSGRRMGLIR